MQAEKNGNANSEEIHDMDSNDLTLPYNEQEIFSSIWNALQWKHVQMRVPLCFRKTIRNRYMLANVVYIIYAIGILIIDFNPSINEVPDVSSSNDTLLTTTPIMSVLDQPVVNSPLANRMFIGFGVVHIILAFLYAWAWEDRSWLDVVLIPEYLNHIEAALYLWSACWYSREDTLGGYYTMAVHRIELTAAIVELIASFGWIYTWYITYVRTLGRGFTLDDPDVIAFSCTTIASILYLIYNIQVNIEPELYGSYYLYTNADILYFIGACYYFFAGMRDDNWFWFLPLSGQYGIAAGRIQVETAQLPEFGKPPILVTDPCRRRKTRAPESSTIELADRENATITVSL